MGTRNVLLVTVDSLRHDHVGVDRNGQPVTPRLDELSEDGVRFTEAVANGSSTPTSFPTILTSTYPLTHGGYRYLDDGRPFVAQALRDEGYETVAYHSNPHLGPDKNYDRGFDYFNDKGEGTDRSEVDALNRLKNAVERRVDRDSTLYGLLRRGWHILSMTADTAAYASAESISDSAVEWIDDWDGDRPFFMWLHYMDAHYPFTPPREQLRALDVEPPSRRRTAALNGKMHEDPGSMTERDREQLLDLYRAEIRYTDQQFGRVIDRLERSGALEDTAVVFTADHGEAFGEHDRYGHHPSPYDELVRVPLVVGGGATTNSRTVGEQVSLVDLGPTVYDLTGVETPEQARGQSLEPALAGDGVEEEVAICTGSPTTIACRTGEWKCIWRIEDGETELYDLEDDPGERRNVSGRHTEVVEELKGTLEWYLEEADATDVELPAVETSAETEERLRDLGYVK